jgi:hypothetical protein
MKRTLVATAFGVLFLLTREVAHSENDPVPLNVDAVCPSTLRSGASNTVIMHVFNRSGTPLLIERFAIGYVGNVPGTGPVISGPFVRRINPPVTLGPETEQQFPLGFPSVPTTFPSNRVISAVGVVFTGDGRQGVDGILGSAHCLAPVAATP